MNTITFTKLVRIIRIEFNTQSCFRLTSLFSFLHFKNEAARVEKANSDKSIIDIGYPKLGHDRKAEWLQCAISYLTHQEVAP